MIVALPAKVPSEFITISFMFASELVNGETVSSCTVTASAYAGADPSPTAILFGGPTLTIAPTVQQLVQAGMPGVTYLLVATATLSSGRILVRNATLPVASF